MAQESRIVEASRCPPTGIAIASGGLDSLPHNGYVITTIRGVCRETHKLAYWSMFCMTVVIPLFGLDVALLLL